MLPIALFSCICFLVPATIASRGGRCIQLIGGVLGIKVAALDYPLAEFNRFQILN
jgi:hypothetical protein